MGAIVLAEMGGNGGGLGEVGGIGGGFGGCRGFGGGGEAGGLGGVVGGDLSEEGVGAGDVAILGAEASGDAFGGGGQFLLGAGEGVEFPVDLFGVGAFVGEEEQVGVADAVGEFEFGGPFLQGVVVEGVVEFYGGEEGVRGQREGWGKGRGGEWLGGALLAAACSGAEFADDFQIVPGRALARAWPT